MFDRLYQENWLEQVTTKKGQSNWSIASLCSELVAKMAKDIGMTIRKGIVVPFLPCLVAFWGFHPYMFFQCFFKLVKPRGSEGGSWAGRDRLNNPSRYRPVAKIMS